MEGISRKTGYKIFERYRDEGLEALTDRSRRPVRYANQLPDQIERMIVRLKQDKPHWDARKISELLVRRHSREYATTDIKGRRRPSLRLVKLPGETRHVERSESAIYFARKLDLKLYPSKDERAGDENCLGCDRLRRRGGLEGHRRARIGRIELTIAGRLPSKA